MTAISRHASAPLPTAAFGADKADIVTPFGPVSVDAASILDITGGILGFEGRSRFALAPVPNPRLGRFMILQSVEDPSISFIVLPMAEDGPIAGADREEACTMLNSVPEDTIFLLIVTVRREKEGSVMTVNLRAPIAVDTTRRQARQCVLSNNAYTVRHPL